MVTTSTKNKTGDHHPVPSRRRQTEFAAGDAAVETPQREQSQNSRADAIPAARRRRRPAVQQVATGGEAPVTPA